MTDPVIVGIRHHSPACARLVGSTIEALRPKYVLIEGPSDYNPQMDQLQLDHQLPIALFSSSLDSTGGVRSYSPFCEYSPEWVALRTAHKVGAQVLFCDLPAWHKAMNDQPNRYRDRGGLNYQRLAQKMGYDSLDALWDAAIESVPQEKLQEHLEQYFQELRQVDPSQDDLEREQFMAQCISWACAQGPTMVVCGGYHAPWLRQHWNSYPAQWPDCQGQGRTSLVPFSFQRLDSFRGYAAGMPSPYYYQRVWEDGFEQAAKDCLVELAQRLRAKKQATSSADLIAAWSNAQMLQRLRNHSHLLRCDLLDGLAAALIKEALDTPLPWNYRGPLDPATHPALVAMMETFSGQRRGRLDVLSKLPPLCAEAQQQITAHQLTPSKPARTFNTNSGQSASYVLHRLGILSIEGFRLLNTDAKGMESWSLAESPDFEASLIEASAYGDDLHSASSAALQEQLTPQSGAAQVSSLLLSATLAGLFDLSIEWFEQLSRAIERDVQIFEIAPALRNLERCWRVQQNPQFLQVVQRGSERLWWLLEGLPAQTPTAEFGLVVTAVTVLRDLLRLEDFPGDSRLLGTQVATRLAQSAQSSLPLQGSCLGLLWSLQHLPETPAPPSMVAASRTVPPENLGDFLFGLFSLARQECLDQVELLEQLHQTVRQLAQEDFLKALPPLRQAFERFSPQEKQQLAVRVAQWLGLSSPSQLLRSSLPHDLAIAAVELDRWVHEEVTRHGW